MSENPYAPPAISGPIESAQIADAEPSDTGWQRVFNWTPFSILGGLLTGHFHMSMYHTGRVSPVLACVGMGAIFAVSLHCGVYTSSVLKGRKIQRLLVSAGLFCSCVAGFASIPFLSQGVRALQLYPDFSIAAYLPVCLCLILMALALTMAQVLSWRYATWFVLMGLPMAIVSQGALDKWIIPGSSFESYYWRRMLLFTLSSVWLMGWIAFGSVRSNVLRIPDSPSD